MNDKHNYYYKVAKEVAREAGKIIFQNFSLKVITDWKADGTPLTKTDTDINSMVINTIGKNFPEHTIIGEEESSEKKMSDYIWSCDPIDGTIPFSHGLPNCTFSLALVKNGEPLLGVVCEPFQNIIFSALKGNGAYINDKLKLTVNHYNDFQAKVVHVDSLPKNGNIYDALIKEKAFICSYLSSIYGAKQVATGHFVGSVLYTTKPWDAAALKVIIEEAGGKCTSLNGNDQRYDGKIDGFIASNGILHDRLVSIVKSADK